jgi:adenylosuccinate synthase
LISPTKSPFSYKLHDKVIYNFPGSISDLAQVEVEYVTLPGWEKSTVDVRDFRDLPENAQNYVRFIEKDLDVPVKWIGVGKGRESIIKVY